LEHPAFQKNNGNFREDALRRPDFKGSYIPLAPVQIVLGVEYKIFNTYFFQSGMQKQQAAYPKASMHPLGFEYGIIIFLFLVRADYKLFNNDRTVKVELNRFGVNFCIRQLRDLS
jgi:hypothetical protein